MFHGPTLTPRGHGSGLLSYFLTAGAERVSVPDFLPPNTDGAVVPDLSVKTEWKKIHLENRQEAQYCIVILMCTLPSFSLLCIWSGNFSIVTNAPHKLTALWRTFNYIQEK